MPTVKGARARRANRRLSKIRLVNPKALRGVDPSDGYTPREARKIKAKHARMKSRGRFETKRKPSKSAYNPLAPLTGPRLRREMNAATRLEFGDEQRELNELAGANRQTTANTAQAYEDYRQALRESTARINETNRLAAEKTEGRIDTAYQQDAAGVAARNAAASETAAKLGRGPVQSEEGSRAVEAQRSQGNQSAARLRGQGAADTKYMELRGATAALAKAQAVGRSEAKGERIQRENIALQGKKGAFKTDFRRKSREDERAYAAVKKEFGLKEKELLLENKATKADRRLERQKTNAQKIIARMYSSADRAGARAQIRVAQLQLQKGRITKSQYRKIVNEYRGLPGGAKINGKPGSTTKGKGSGPNGSLLPWERDKVSNAVNILSGQKAKAKDRATWMKRMQAEGVPARLARIAWNKYLKSIRSNSNTPQGDVNRPGGVGDRP